MNINHLHCETLVDNYTIPHFDKNNRPIKERFNKGFEFCVLNDEQTQEDIKNGKLKIIEEYKPDILENCLFFNQFKSELLKGNIVLKEGQQKNDLLKNFCGYVYCNRKLSFEFCRLLKHYIGEASGWCGKNIQFNCLETRKIIKRHFRNQGSLCDACNDATIRALNRGVNNG